MAALMLLEQAAAFLGFGQGTAAAEPAQPDDPTIVLTVGSALVCWVIPGVLMYRSVHKEASEPESPRTKQLKKQNTVGAMVAEFETVGSPSSPTSSTKKRPSDAAGTEASYSALGAFGIARQRTGWLLIFLCGLLLTTKVMHSFEALLASEVELAFFVPLLVGHGGNSGGQTVSTVIRALGCGALRLRDGPRVVFKEAVAGVVQSIVLVSVLAPCLVFLMGISQPVALVVAFTMPAVGLLANSVGAVLPFLITWLGHDPAVIVGPLMTTSVDAGGVGTYLMIASLTLPKRG